jgi:hypothetical protein
MTDIKVTAGQQSDIKVRVGQQNAVKVISSVSGSAGASAVNAENVIGGIASVTQLHVSGISTFVGVSTFKNDVYIDGDLYVLDDLKFDEFTARNANITGVTTTNNFVVTGTSGFVGLVTANSITSQNLNITGLTISNNFTANNATVINEFYYVQSERSGIAYFNQSGLMVSTGATSSAINYTNYILTTDNSDIPTWSNTIDGGAY